MISKYVFKVFKKMDTQENFEICSKSINTLEKIKWCHSDVVNAKFEQISSLLQSRYRWHGHP